MNDKTTHDPVPLPVLRGGSIEDTLTGFRERIDRDERIGKRTERRLTILFIDIRGWNKIIERAGADTASTLSHQVVERALEIIADFAGTEVRVSGEPTRPRIVASFDGEDGAERAVRAAWAVRSVTAESMHPAFGHDRFEACIGINSGTVAETRVTGSGMQFRSNGTVKMFGQRLQEFSGPGQVLISAETYNDVAEKVRVRSMGSVRTNSDGSKQMAYCVLELLA
jgi:class 3 adenylate cyclase